MIQSVDYILIMRTNRPTVRQMRWAWTLQAFTRKMLWWKDSWRRKLLLKQSVCGCCFLIIITKLYPVSDWGWETNCRLSSASLLLLSCTNRHSYTRVRAHYFISAKHSPIWEECSVVQAGLAHTASLLLSWMHNSMCNRQSQSLVRQSDGLKWSHLTT